MESQPVSFDPLLKIIKRLIFFISIAFVVGLIIVVGVSVHMFRPASAAPTTAQTKYINVFPYNMDEIVKLIAQTSDRLDILSDTPAYGAYSNPNVYERYRAAILKLVREKKIVSMVVYSDNETAIETKKQISWDKKDISVFERYIKYHGISQAPTSATEFYELLQQEPRKFKRELGDLVREVSGELPVFIWLSDNKRAIVSFYNLGQGAREVSIRTDEADLIGVLHGIVENIRSKSESTSFSTVGTHN